MKYLYSLDRVTVHVFLSKSRVYLWRKGTNEIAPSVIQGVLVRVPCRK